MTTERESARLTLDEITAIERHVKTEWPIASVDYLRLIDDLHTLRAEHEQCVLALQEILRALPDHGRMNSGQVHWIRSVAQTGLGADPLHAELVTIETLQLRAERDELRRVVRKIGSIAITDPDDRDFWPGGSDEFASAIWTRCVEALNTTPEDLVAAAEQGEGR